MNSCGALILAGGTGSRFGKKVPKQYQLLNGRPVLRYAVDAFLSHPMIDMVRVVIRECDEENYAHAVRGFTLLPPTKGGHTRQSSTLRGLKSFEAAPPSKILIHDAARPFPSARLISEVIDALDHFDGAIPTISVADTLKKIDSRGLIEDTLDRSTIVRAQTPQGFKYQDILKAHETQKDLQYTDDAQIACNAGLKVQHIRGDPKNLKITTQEDMQQAKRIIGAESFAFLTGIGYDVHKYGDGDQITLGGVPINHNKGLVGHSDADVLLHSITDAILGAIAKDDIGALFPDSDPKWSNADSSIFLQTAHKFLSRNGGEIIHIDTNIICEKPKIGPYRQQIKSKISELLSIPIHRISIKATTTEGLGFTGRDEGIAVQAIVTIRRRE